MYPIQYSNPNLPNTGQYCSPPTQAGQYSLPPNLVSKNNAGAKISLQKKLVIEVDVPEEFTLEQMDNIITSNGTVTGCTCAGYITNLLSRII